MSASGKMLKDIGDAKNLQWKISVLPSSSAKPNVYTEVTYKYPVFKRGFTGTRTLIELPSNWGTMRGDHQELYLISSLAIELYHSHSFITEKASLKSGDPQEIQLNQEYEASLFQLGIVDKLNFDICTLSDPLFKDLKKALDLYRQHNYAAIRELVRESLRH